MLFYCSLEARHSHSKKTYVLKLFLSNSSILTGVVQFHNLKEVISNSIRICLATHSDERCVASCVGISVMVALLLQGKYDHANKSDMDDLLATVCNASIQQMKNDEYIKEFQRYMKATDYQSIKLHEKRKVHYVFKTMAAAVLAVRSHQDFKTALANVILQGGHGSMNGCITGALLGCMSGFTSLPKAWVEGLLPGHIKWLNWKINRLLDKMGLP